MLELNFGTQGQFKITMLQTAIRNISIDIRSVSETSLLSRQLGQVTQFVYDSTFDQIHYIKIRDWLSL